MKKSHLLALALILGLVLVPASATAVPGGTVSGTVTLDGAPLVGVEVFLFDNGAGPRFACTDAIGEYSFTNVDTYAKMATGPGGGSSTPCTNIDFLAPDGGPLLGIVKGGGVSPADVDFEVERPEFTTLTPARMADTRVGGPTIDGTYSGDGIVKGGDVYEIKIAGRGAVPALASAAILNLTVTGGSGPGFATLHPCGAVPNASSLNYATATTDPNEVISKLSASGSVCVFVLTDVHVIVDAVGYIAATSNFVSLAPSRFADTRPGLTTVDGQFAGDGIVAGGTTYEVQITGRNGVPASAATAAINVTVTGGAGPGFATTYPCGPVPTASSLNYGMGATIPNELIAKLSPAGKICVFVLTDVHLIMDVVGYMPDSAGYQTFDPARFADTRPGMPTIDGQFSGDGIVSGGTFYEVKISDRNGIATTASAAVINLTVTGGTGPGFATAYPCGTVPTASSLNYGVGTTRPNELIAKLSSTGTICVFALTDVHVIIDVLGFQ